MIFRMKAITVSKGATRDQKKLIAVVLTILFVYYAVFYVFPIVYAFIGSFFNWNIAMGKFDFNGVENYQRVWAAKKFRVSILNSVFFALTSTALRLGIGCLIAVLIFYVPRRMQSVYRMLYFLPLILSMVATSYIWKWFFGTNNGLVNILLRAVGLPGPNWLKSRDYAMSAVVITTIWKDVGFAVIMYLAGLYQISDSVYEAAEIDGANKYHIFAHIMLPMLGNVTLFLLITSINGYIQSFDQFFILTEGGPGTASYVMAFYLYEMAFENYNFGQASAISFIMAAIVMVLSVLNLALQKNGSEAIV